MTNYYSGTSGDPFTEATIHTSDDCEVLADEPGNVRPIAESSTDTGGLSWCSECATDSPETCDVVKGDGDVCGRERPCPYHD